MKGLAQGFFFMSAAAMLLVTGGCGGEAQEGPASPAPSASHAVQEATGNVTGSFPATAAEVKSYLQAEHIPNGDIYLADGKVHINIVGLTPGIASGFAEEFREGSYELHDVEFTAAELIGLQRELADTGVMAKLNLYGSTVDIIRNRLVIDLPDDALQAAEAELAGHQNADMLVFVPAALGEPHVTGTIVEVETEGRERPAILILEPGQQEPTYWFSFYEYSRLYNGSGDEIAADGLRPGQQVKIWSTGTINTSLPAQGTVRRLELNGE